MNLHRRQQLNGVGPVGGTGSRSAKRRSCAGTLRSSDLVVQAAAMFLTNLPTGGGGDVLSCPSDQHRVIPHRRSGQLAADATRYPTHVQCANKLARTIMSQKV